MIRPAHAEACPETEPSMARPESENTTPPGLIGGCQVCGRPTHGAFARCYCCTSLVGQLQMPLASLVAMVEYRVEYRVGDRMHRRLRGYKDAPVGEARTVYAGQLAWMMERWMTANGSWLSGRVEGVWDVVTTVPSSRRPGPPPVDAIVGGVPSLCDLRRSLLVRGPGPTGHLLADRHGFVPAPGLDLDQLRNLAVLVIDDSVTTGARAQSAAAALRLAGARVAGVLVIGRAMPAVVSSRAEGRTPA